MPRAYHEFSNEALLLLAAQNDHEARRERLIREVMHVDAVLWPDAATKVQQMELEACTHPTSSIGMLPYKIGIAGAVIAASISIPMVFHLPTALWFNEYFVTTDLPEAGDTDTPLEVSIWTWQWNEPAMGTLSFILLCAQFARGKMTDLYAARHGPFASFLRQRRAKFLLTRYPQYSPVIVADFARTAMKAPPGGASQVRARSEAPGKQSNA